MLRKTRALITRSRCRENLLEIRGKKVIIITAWNEWAEGSAIEPGLKEGAVYRFDYINRVRKVFGGRNQSGNSKPGGDLISNGVTDKNRLWANVNDQVLQDWHIVHGSREGEDSFKLWRIWNESSKSVYGSFVGLLPVYKPWREARYFYLKFKAWCGDNYNQTCRWQSGIISWTGSADKRPTLFGVENKIWFYPSDLNKTSLPGQVNRVWVDLKGKPFYQGQIQQASLQLRIRGQKGKIKILEAGFTNKVDRLESLDVNQNGIVGDRGDVVCFIVSYLKQQGRSIKVGMGDFYDINFDGFFSRQDVVGAIVKYLQEPKRARGGLCVGVGN